MKRFIPIGVPAKQVGTKARHLLAEPEFAGQILAVVSDAAYLVGPGEEILWVAREGLPAHRRCILAAFPQAVVRVGMNCAVRERRLLIGEQLAIDLANAATWHAVTVGPAEAVPLAAVQVCLQRLPTQIPSPSDGDGLGQMIYLASAIASGREPVIPGPLSPLVAQAMGPIIRLARACLRQDIAGVAREGRELVGLGAGLTPSGDDFLGGLLFAVHSLPAAYPEKFGWDERPITDLIAWSRAKTNRISHAILGDLALGHGPEPLHGLVVSILQGHDVDRLVVDVNRLLQIGHTSGWDLLAGTFTGLLLGVGEGKGEGE